MLCYGNTTGVYRQMKHHWQELLQQLDYKEGEKILDVGGAYDPVPIADVVIDCLNLGKGGKSYTLLDLNCQGFPFPDNYFDVCICSQTLEDLPSPRLAMIEMSRVAKRGIIEMPHRGPESLINRYYDKDKPDCAMDDVWHFGVGHHKWLFEEIDDGLHAVPKIQYLLMYYPIPGWRGDHGIRYIWRDNIKCSMIYDIDENVMAADYRRFREDNRQYWE